MNEPISNKLIALGSLIYLVISGLILYFWKRTATIDYLQQLFSLENIARDIWLSLLGSFVLLLFLGVLIAMKKVDLPSTKGVQDMVALFQGHRSNVYVASTVTVFGEELLFRGILLLMLGTFMPAWVALLLISLLFVAMHYKDQYEGQPYLLIYLFAMSSLAGFITVEQHTLWGALIVHALSNLVAGLLIRHNVIKITNNEHCSG